jgi:ribonucleoside-diphosphate reductase alpha chain
MEKQAKKVAVPPASTPLLPTPPLPTDLPQVNLTDNARQVLVRRYVRRGPDGNPAESVEEMFWRVAYNVARVEENWGGDVDVRAREFYTLLTSKSFFPNSPTFTGAGTPLGQLAACFVLAIADDMGRHPDGIFQTLRNAALIQQTGGGNGFTFSRLRPHGTLVNSSAGQATGPVGFLRVYDNAFGEIAQGGSRRGANMGVLRVDHPDIEEFITCKTDEHAITNFNISVGITDAFMRAVENDEEWSLRFPEITSPLYKGFHGTFEQAERLGIPFKLYRKVRARDLFARIVKQAHHNGEPGMLFLDAANRQNPVAHLYELEATNPCGEQWLGPNENCCLGSVNLAQHQGPEGTVDWETLRKNVVLSTIFLDDVVEANAYVPAVPALKEAAHRARRIGLGIMGLADLMYHAGIRYGSPEGQEFGAQVMEFVRYTAMQTSIALAASRGAFPAIQGSIYDPQDFRWEAPTSLVPYENDWGRPPVDWDSLTSDLRAHGIRNAAQTTIAPTGTIATVAGCEGYGCEPVFALAYIRHVNDNGKDLKLTYASPQFEHVLQSMEFAPAEREEILNQIMREGTCQGVEALPEEIRNTFVVSADISAEEHVRMQAALQAFVDNSLSKTINFPAGTTEDEVARAYMLAWKLGCKGITVYVTGSRDVVVLETHATADKKKESTAAVESAPAESIPAAVEIAAAVQAPIWHETRKPRPRSLPGFTYSIQTPLGKAYVTVNENGSSQPFEVFINTAKAGSDTAAVSEAIGRLISYTLRLASPIEPRQRLAEITRQMEGIGGGRPLGFGPNRVRSLPDGVSQVLSDYLLGWQERVEAAARAAEDCADKVNGNGHGQAGINGPVKEIRPNADQPSLFSNKIGDLCPECGQAAVINEEGCRKCYACGYSEC